jgi:hypothetical protein
MRFLWKLAPAFAAAALVSSGAVLHSDFEGGSTGRIDKVSDRHFHVGVEGETDQDGRNRQATWYYFRVDDAPREEMIFDMIDLPGEYNYRKNSGAITQETPPVISYDGKTWTHITDLEYDRTEPKLRIRIKPASSRFWVAHTPPYTNSDLAALRTDLKRRPDFEEQVIGKTVESRDIYLWTIGGGSGKKTVWLMFRQHSWESGSSWVAEGLIRTLTGADERGRRLRDRYVWKMYPMCDPDGVARGGVRFNRHGYDLNRNWDVIKPDVMPEITAQRKAIAEWIAAGNSIDLFMSLHNTETAEYLEGPPSGKATPEIARLAEKYFETLKTRTTFHPSRPLFYADESTTPGKPGRMTVIQGLWRDFQIPAFLMEQRVAYNEKLGRPPTIEDRLRFGQQLAEALAAAID